MGTKTVKFVLDEPKKNSVKYKEVDASGNEPGYGYAYIGALYVQKRTFNGSESPKELNVTINWD